MRCFTVLAALCVPFLIVACSGNEVLTESLNDDGVPTWVGQGSSILKSRQSRVFHGVGSAHMMGDFSLQTSVANRRAREEIARIVTSFMEIVSREYIATGQASYAGFDEQDVAKQIEVLSRMDLSKIEVVGHWSDDGSKVIYAIAQMDIAKVRQAIKEMASVNKGLKAYISVEGDNIFDRIAKKEQ